jgi:FKBP-type peptidyl-prolyl cis-trans isomerase
MNKGDPGAPLVPDYSRVTVNYEGRVKYPNGKLGPIFDSSYKKGKPFTFTLGEGKVILGWEYAV